MGSSNSSTGNWRCDDRDALGAGCDRLERNGGCKKSAADRSHVVAKTYGEKYR